MQGAQPILHATTAALFCPPPCHGTCSLPDLSTWAVRSVAPFRPLDRHWASPSFSALGYFSWPRTFRRTSSVHPTLELQKLTAQLLESIVHSFALTTKNPRTRNPLPTLPPFFLPFSFFFYRCQFLLLGSLWQQHHITSGNKPPSTRPQKHQHTPVDWTGLLHTCTGGGQSTCVSYLLYVLIVLDGGASRLHPSTIPLLIFHKPTSYITCLNTPLLAGPGPGPSPGPHCSLPLPCLTLDLISQQS